MSDRGTDRKPQERSDDWRIVLVAVPGCMSSAICGSLEAFAIANALRAGEGPNLRVEVATSSKESTLGFGGLAIPSNVGLDAIEHADVVVVPPILGSPHGLASAHAELVDRLAIASAGGSIAAATCTGTFLLAETGVLNGRRATTTPAFRDLFHRRYPEVLLRTAMRVVDEGSVVTAGATTSYLDLALALIARSLGPRVALESARILSTDRNPRSQQPFLLPRPSVEHADDEVRKAEQWITQHLAEPFDTDSLARIAATSPRSFLRRFRNATGESPREYVQRVRVEAAMKDLEATQLSIEEITTQCGYADTRSFRRLFHKQTGLSPAEYRRRFGYAG